MLTLTVSYLSKARTRYSSRSLAAHATMAELVAWAEETCREGEQVGQIVVSVQQQAKKSIGPFTFDRVGVKRLLSQRLFH